MEWFKKLVEAGQKLLQGESKGSDETASAAQAGQDLKNPDQIDSEMLSCIGKYLALVEEVDPNMAVELSRYVIDNGSSEVLLRLSGNAEACKMLGYTNTYSRSDEADKLRCDIFNPQRTMAAASWMRLGEVLNAASTPLTTNFKLPPGFPNWLRILAAEMARFKRHGRQKLPSDLRRQIEDLEQIISIAELPADILVRPLLDPDQSVFLKAQPYVYQEIDLSTCISGLDKYFAMHSDAVRKYFAEANADQRIHALSVLTQVGFDFSIIFDIVLDLSVGSAKTTRLAVLPILSKLKEPTYAALEKVLKEGAAAERNEAVSTLWNIFGKDCHELLLEHAKTEKAERVKQTIDKLVAAQEFIRNDDSPQFPLPPIAVPLGQVPIGASVRDNLKAFFKASLDAANRSYEASLIKFQAPDKPKWMKKPDKPELNIDKTVDALILFLEGRSDDFTPSGNIRLINHMRLLRESATWLAPPDIELIHVVRLCNAMGALTVQPAYGTIYCNDQGLLESYYGRCSGSFGLRDLDACMASLKDGEPGRVPRSYLRSTRWYSGFADWCPPEAVWPAFAERPELIRDALNFANKAAASSWWAANERRNSFDILATFPEVPSEYIPILWNLALGEGKSERLHAQRALESLPGKAERVLVALGDGKQSVRSAAAEWLGKLGEKSAVGALKTAFEKEKQELAKGSIMQALDALGADVDEFMDRDKLLKEAQAGLNGKRPKSMEWVPLQTLPVVHWSDTGKQVAPEILEWWVVQSVQQKLTQPGPILKRYLSMCNKLEAANYANYLLAAWIGRDTSHPSHEEASAKAEAETDSTWAKYGSNKYYVDHYKGEKGNLYKEVYQRISGEFLHSAIDQKGILAIVGASGDGSSVKTCEKYIRTYFGGKIAQCKGLIDVLSTIEHPLALQSLLSFANRFRTKSIKQLAEENVTQLAEKRGWTIEELADRTIPDGGFARAVDENDEPVGSVAVLELDFGSRQFEAKLSDDLEPLIYVKGESKSLKNLPAPGKTDDEEKAKEAKKLFSDAKKSVKEVVKRQTERLFEALCTQRSWNFADWNRYLAQHPIVGRLCVRLVWLAYSPPAADEKHGAFLGAFRPLGDGTLTNSADEEVKLPDDALVCLAHTCNMPSELEAAWLKHLADYDVTALFPQFHRVAYVPPEGKVVEIKDFEGHMLTTFKLRSRATKLGYVRGDAEDGGSFCIYRKVFSSLNMQAVIEFTGSYLPEEDLPAGLVSLYFSPSDGRSAGSSWDQQKMVLTKVPPVLVSECYNDFKQIAADGSGFDAQWRQKGLYS